MLIGESYEKIEFQLMGWDLMEPSAFIGDTLLFIVSIWFAFKISKFNEKDAFFNNWKLFFITFGIGFLFGGFGHLLYNYLGLVGKVPSWVLGIISVYFMEQAMITIIKKDSVKRTMNMLSRLKLILALSGVVMMFFVVDLHADYSKGMIVPTINSAIGVVYSLGFIGYKYYMENASFKYLWISVILLFPSIIFQGMNINFHEWFDKNDASHFLLLISLFFYFKGVLGFLNDKESSLAIQ